MKTTLQIRSIVNVLGKLVVIEAVMMLVPLVICLIYGENDWKSFALASMTALFAGGIAAYATQGQKPLIKTREGFVITALIWIVYGLFGMIPYMLCDRPLSLTDAMFETISGFTTTGVSSIMDVDAYSHGILFWRALTQWIGGLGIILFLLALMPELNKSAGISMYYAESSGITHDKLHPRIRQTVLSLWKIYIVVTAVSIILLWIGPMTLFDSVCQSFAAIATGGFSTHNEGISFWQSNYVYSVLILVMTVGGINFMVIYSAWTMGIKRLISNDVTKIFFMVLITSYFLLVVSILLRGYDFNIDNCLFIPLFHVVSAITSTGFSISEAENWGQFSLFLTIMLMLCGSCAGSTAGGIKIDRLIVMCRNLKNEIKKSVFPKRIYVVNLNGTFLQSSLISRVSAFVSLYIIIVLVSAAIITLYGYSFSDSIFMASSCIGCNGLGYGATGINSSYALLQDSIKWLLTTTMIIGRLELFTFISLLLPSFWKK